MKVYVVILEWSDFVSTDVETTLTSTKEKAINIIKNYLNTDSSIIDLRQCCENISDIFEADFEIRDDYVHLNDGNNWCSIYIEEKDVI